MKNQRPPRDNLYRAVFPGVELRADGEGDTGPVMSGHFAVFNQATEINSLFEGNFIERFAPGAFKKTIRENRDGMRVLFQHGFDPQVGDKPLGPIRTLKEDGEGAYYEVPLLDASYVREDVLPGLRAGLYGASFRFRVIREEIDEDPGASADNPRGLPERTVKEAEVREFGPVTFPAYEGASAGIRSLSDEFLIGRFTEEPDRLREIIGRITPQDSSQVVISVPVSRSLIESDDESLPGELGKLAYEAARNLVEDDSTGNDPSREEAPEEPTREDDSEQSETDAPPETGAEAEPHPDEGRRDEPEPLYGTPAATKPPTWRL